MNFNGLKVGAFMDELRRMPADEQVKYDFAYFGPTKLQSYRGYYEDAALGYDSHEFGHYPYEYPTVKQLLEHFEQTIGKVFEGWKGGNSRPIRFDTSLWVSNPGEAGDTIIVGVQRFTYVTILTRDERDESVGGTNGR